MTRIRTLLIANRGEIACRIIRTAREMGIRTVAVFSDADAEALFVAQADRAVRLPGVAPAQTYLRGDLIIEAALRTGADAVHPGYGFLSENADFAQAVGDAGLVFVGPTPDAIRAMGSKIRAKEMMAASGVPVLRGATVTGESTEAELIAGVADIGYPLLVKASAGGGGRGMRIVTEPSGLAESVASARREAGSAFGDDAVFVEKYITAPRHVEVQIFGDTHGTVVHLFERECSIQRRYQKVIEEAPSPVVSPALREELGAAAVAAGTALGYVGAGTVEFILDPSGAFHFLEVNTRLQVEHPVTELITGLDLVRLQLLVAEGEPLPPEALDATITGHAVEVRLYAEDPAAGFLPTSGRLREFELPSSVRTDTGFASGDTVSIHYDPMLAKVIAHAPTRTEAALVLAGALREARLHGVRTNRDLLAGILTEPEFLAARIDTAYLERHTVDDLSASPSGEELRRAVAAAALALRARQRAGATVQPAVSAGWRNVVSAPALVALAGEDGRAIDVRYRIDARHTELTVDGAALGEQLVFAVAEAGPDVHRVTLEIDGLREEFRVVFTDETVDGRRAEVVTIDVDGPFGGTEFTVVDLLPPPGSLAAAGSLTAPMPGSVVRVLVDVGAAVVAGQPIVVLEAMKMEHAVKSPQDGVVESVLVAVGEQVDIGQALAVVTGDEPAGD
ncbi:acetyl/propionyl-CoA carboxylase subunit alpha [Subtercola boreus]|uniref:Biotin-dependent 3-methylcrotonyl-coenzyme A carboxylase alpha1 subunit n=1 Tax=Subtercola boreus TaxID=120213 RepID=A0A3E0VM80_9MICO|nr:biotin carboxylase N-terminal domain-containing protein [Subtercola boreus]RFA09997.1 acetyl/propionyl-CoA carboxylase subunit alpha [Subtercola boreus]TQL52857.1 acetyl/propionyl-CoA carboxylase alpha subunit [Subtercola boreus]